MSENERLRQALEEHKRRHPETEDETLVALGRVLYPKREAEREEMAKARAIIKQAQDEPVVRNFRTTQEPYKSREDLAKERTPNATGILSVIREKRGFKEIFEEKEDKRGV